MKAQELRIGNFVNTRHPYGQTFTTVESIAGQTINDDDIRVYEGIPLTSEWLVKMGFTRKQVYEQVDEYTSSNRLFKIQTDESLFAISGGNELLEKLELKTVHQLQNLYFALTGEELKIV